MAGVGAIVFDDAGRVLLIRRGKPPLEGRWVVPGGTLEWGETLDAAIRREIREETGAEIEIVGRLPVIEVVRGDHHFVIVDAVARATGGTLRPSSDALDAAWVARDDLASYDPPAEVVEAVDRAREQLAREELERGLAALLPGDAKEALDRDRILGFVRRHARPFDRGIAEGHLTGSALVMSARGEGVLLLHHRKLDRWLQPGGHADSDERDGLAVARREAVEETGVVVDSRHGVPRPFDVDVHRIPARGPDPEHDHLDLRYLFTADPARPLAPQVAETRAVRWFRTDEALAMPLDPGLLRMIRKAKALLAP